VRTFVTASAQIEKHVRDLIQVVCNAPMIECYGLTECGAIVYSDRTDPVGGHIGGPLMGIKIRLRDIPDLGYLTTDKPYPRGEMCVKGEPVFSGYFKKPEKTAEAFDEEGWFKTGDVVSLLPNGAI